MTKHIIALMTILLSVISMQAQTFHYDYSRGQVKGQVTITDIRQDDGKRQVSVTIPDGSEFQQITDESYRTESWQYINKAEDTDIVISLTGGTYRISGRHKGKGVSRTVKSLGHDWLQSIYLVAGNKVRREGASMEYECFRPDNLSLNVMVATNVGKASINGFQTNDIKVSASGIKGKFWSSHYYTGINAGRLIEYNAVEGLPGTPPTTWRLKK